MASLFDQAQVPALKATTVVGLVVLGLGIVEVGGQREERDLLDGGPREVAGVEGVEGQGQADRFGQEAYDERPRPGESADVP